MSMSDASIVRNIIGMVARKKSKKTIEDAFLNEIFSVFDNKYALNGSPQATGAKPFIK